jgi:hypothetical protein
MLLIGPAGSLGRWGLSRTQKALDLVVLCTDVGSYEGERYMECGMKESKPISVLLVSSNWINLDAVDMASWLDWEVASLE